MLVVYGHGQCVNMRLYLMGPETWAREANCQSLPVDQSDRLLAYWRIGAGVVNRQSPPGRAPGVAIPQDFPSCPNWQPAQVGK